MISTLRSILNLHVALLAVITVLFVETPLLFECCAVVTCVMILDFFFHVTGLFRLDKDMLLHHFFVLCFFTYLYGLSEEQRSMPDVSDCVSLILMTECSTIFLTIHYLSRSFPRTHWIHTSWLKHVWTANQVAFVGTFMYYRIYCFVKMLYSGHYISTVLTCSGVSGGWYMIGATLGLFTLNVYWAVLIIKKVMKGC